VPPRATTAPAAKDRVYAHVKERILDGGYPGGMLLSEGEVAGELEVSRTPVREAFLVLEAEGLMRLYPKRGALVVPLMPEEMGDVMETRLLVEGHCALRVAERRPPDTMAVLRDLVERQAAALDTGDLRAFVAADRDFHHALVAGAGNRVLERLSDAIRDRQRRMVASTVLGDPAIPRGYLEEHRAVLAALEAGDGPAAAERLRAHLTGSLAIMRGAAGRDAPPPT
jgi:DNA-binding GntR family transcriptional regulator